MNNLIFGFSWTNFVILLVGYALMISGVVYYVVRRLGRTKKTKKS